MEESWHRYYRGKVETGLNALGDQPFVNMRADGAGIWGVRGSAPLSTVYRSRLWEGSGDLPQIHSRTRGGESDCCTGFSDLDLDDAGWAFYSTPGLSPLSNTALIRK